MTRAEGAQEGAEGRQRGAVRSPQSSSHPPGSPGVGGPSTAAGLGSCPGRRGHLRWQLSLVWPPLNRADRCASPAGGRGRETESQGSAGRPVVARAAVPPEAGADRVFG